MEKGKEKLKASKKRNYKRQIYLLILCMGIGFAFLTSQLSIVGITGVKGGTWRVYFDNVQVDSNSVEATTPVIDADKTRVDFQVQLNSPGDKYEFTVDAVNAGEVNATIQSINMTELDENTSKYLTYEVTYLDGDEIVEADILEAGETQTIKVLVEYNPLVLDADILESNQTLNLSFSIDYIHATSKTPKRFIELVSNTAKLDTNIDFTKSSFFTNGEGLYVKNDTRNSTNPIYYYRGDVNNNALFAGFCWKIVRTTETGGTKLIYNGPQRYIYTELEALDEEDYNFVTQSGEEYTDQSDPFTFNPSTKTWESDSYYSSSSSKSFGITTEEAGDYILNIAINESVNYFNGYIYYADNYETIGNFDALSGEHNWSFKVYDYDPSRIIFISYSKSSASSGGPYDTVSISLAKGVSGILGCDNSGQITTIGGGRFNEKNDSIAYNGYMFGNAYKYYYSSTGTSNYNFGTGVTYSNGQYTLVNSKSGLDSTHHYTCGNSYNTSCSTIQYVFSTSSNSSYQYIKFVGGRTLDDAMIEMRQNKNDSTTKSIVDNWFYTNIVTPLATNNIDYNNYLEDTVWCNDKTTNALGDSKFTNNGWNASNGDSANPLYYSGYGRVITGNPSLTCSNADSYTVSSENGNGVLTYPVGLLTVDEVIYAGAEVNGSYNAPSINYYLNSGTSWWTMTPKAFGSAYYETSLPHMFYITQYGTVYDRSALDHNESYASIRPAISIQSKVKVAADGDGTALNPYVFIVR